MVERGDSGKKIWPTEQLKRNKWGETLQKTSKVSQANQHMGESGSEIQNYIINICSETQT